MLTIERKFFLSRKSPIEKKKGLFVMIFGLKFLISRIVEIGFPL
jgi:hypothetical protein